MPNLFAANPEFFIDPDKDYLAELVGEDKKFASPLELARGKAESDAHITRLEAEQSALRDELATRLKYEEFLDKLNTLPLGTTPQLPSGGDTNLDKSALKPEDVERILEQKITQREADRSAQQNLGLVHNELQKAFGPNYTQHLKRQTQALGLSEQFVTHIAATNPRALFKMLDIGTEAKEDNSFVSPPKNQSFGPTPQGKAKGDSYYEEIRKTKPKEYWSPKIQNEIFEKIKEMGAEAYYKS